MKSPEQGSRVCAADAEVLGVGVGRGGVSTGYESFLRKLATQQACLSLAVTEQ